MKKKVFFLTLFIAVFSFAQVNAQLTKQEFNKKLLLANEQFSYENYGLAFPLFLELYHIDSSNLEINYKLGVSTYFFKTNKQESIIYLEKSKKDYIDSYFYLAKVYHQKSLFNKALDYLQYYKNSKSAKLFPTEDVDYVIDQITNAKLFKSKPENVIVKNIGNIINSAYSEYAPLITSDENTLIFTSRRKGSYGGLKDPNNQYFEDIYISKLENNKWTKPKNIGIPVNSATHDACVTMTQDGKHLYIFRTNKDLTAGDLYLSENSENKWLAPVKLRPDINSRNGIEASACLSPDERTLYFSSNREGGFGGRDIYRVRKLPNNEWSLAENLGAIINTKYDEDAPYMHPDGQTMYFSSRGHKNIGGYDIFTTTIDEEGKFSEPENVGFPINSVYDDIYYIVTPDGKTSYFASKRSGGYGGADIYVMKELEKQKELLMLKGIIYTNDPTYKTLEATITILDYNTKEIQGIYRTNTETGKYLMVLAPRKKYKILVEANGYHNFVDEIDLTQRLRFEDLFKNIDLKQIK